jgi:uncharacterized protein (TIGR03790 family)
MVFRTGAVILLILLGCGIGFALEPDEILVIANEDVAASGRIARYYCQKRAVPDENILSLSLGKSLSDTISRDDYEKRLAEPIRKELSNRIPFGIAGPKRIKCLLTTYGVPIKVGKRGTLKGMKGRLKELKELIKQEKERIEQTIGGNNKQGSVEQKKSNQKLARLQLEINRIYGTETNASVDSELSMVSFGPYELYRWQPNMLKGDVLGLSFKTLMVSRLDGPDACVIKGLIDKAIAAEETGLKGIAYIDSRGIVNKKSLYGHFDQSLRDMAMFTRLRTELPVQEERTKQLFTPGSCPRTAIYCGWYSLKKYIDAFEFVDGAIGYHISSFEAVGLRDPNSSQWCPAMLTDGITATLGAVAEPYLHTFTEPRVFFLKLYEGNCLVEAYYHTKPFNSWQLVLIGDPLYRPFKKRIEND